MADLVLPDDEIAAAADDVLAPVKLFEPRHNTTAYLELTSTKAADRVFFPVIEFFQRSRIGYSLIVPTTIYEGSMVDFWTSAVFHRNTNPPSIRTEIDNQEFILTEQMIREVLQFEDTEDAHNDLPSLVIDDCLQRMGSVRPPNESQIRKYHVCPHWKFLETILIGCLSPRKGGLDGMSYQLASLMVCLIQNRPFNFSRFVFSNLVNNIGNRNTFFMFPRFLQIIIDDRLPNVRHQGRVLAYTPMQHRVFADCRTYGRRPSPPVSDLFGGIIDPAYVEPLLDHESSESDASTPEQYIPEAPHLSPPAAAHIQEILDEIDRTLEVSDSPPVNPQEQPVSDDEPHIHTVAETVEMEERLQQETALERAELRRKREEERDPLYVPEPPRQRRRTVHTTLRPVSRVFTSEPGTSSRAEQVDPSSFGTPTILDSQIIRLMQPLLDQVSRLQTELLNACQRINVQDGIIASQSDQIILHHSRINSLELEVQQLKNRLSDQGENEADDADDDDDSDDDNNDDGDDDGNVGDNDIIMDSDEDIGNEAVGEEDEAEAENTEVGNDAVGTEVTTENISQALVLVLAEAEEPLRASPISFYLPDESTIENIRFDFEDVMEELEDDVDDEYFSNIISFDGLDEFQHQNDAELDEYLGDAEEDEEMHDADTEYQEDNTEYQEDDDVLCPTPLNIIIDDLVPFIELCNYNSDDSADDPVYPPGFEDHFYDDVTVEDWIDSDEEEPEIVNAPEGVNEPERSYPDWFPKPEEPVEQIKTRKYFKVPLRECSGRIISWKYDNDNMVIIIKRTDGIQYFPRSFKRLGTLPKCEVNHIASIKMLNRSNNGMMNWFEDILYREYCNGKYVHIRETFPKLHVNTFRIHPITNQPWVELIYPRVRCKRKIPLEKVPRDFTEYIHFWRYNHNTGEAEIECYDLKPSDNIHYPRKTIVHVYDPLSLINMSFSDLEKLSLLKIMHDDCDEDKEQALKFQRVADVCVAQIIHAGTNLPRH